MNKQIYVHKLSTYFTFFKFIVYLYTLYALAIFYFLTTMPIQTSLSCKNLVNNIGTKATIIARYFFIIISSSIYKRTEQGGSNVCGKV